jgi:hypothetical protein
VTASPDAPHHQRRFASFTITGKSLDPEEVSAALSLSPYRAFKAGDKKGTGDDRWSHGLWSISTEGVVEADDLEAHIAWLLHQLEPEKSELVNVLTEERVKARILCFFEMEKMNDGVEFSAALINRLAALDLPVALDIYNSSL